MSLPISVGAPDFACDYLRDNGLSRAADNLLFCAVFDAGALGKLEQTELNDLWHSGAQVSWWGGPSPVPPPSEASQHLVTIDLADLDGVLDDRSKRYWGSRLQDGLPQRGTLSIFVPVNFEAQNGPWCTVHWQSEIHRSPLIASTEPIYPIVGFLAGASYSLPGNDAGSERVREQLAAAWRLRDPDLAVYAYAYGHPRLAASTGRRLLLSLETGWLLGPQNKLLEVSMTESELRQANFDSVSTAVGDC